MGVVRSKTRTARDQKCDQKGVGGGLLGGHR